MKGSTTSFFFILFSALNLCCGFSGSVTNAVEGGARNVTPIPITVLSGFLGSGKTTLLQNLLENREGLRIAVVVNDVAEVNVDSKLISQKNSADGMVELQNGCACCSRSEELLASLQQLVVLSDTRAEGEGFHHIVIELSGIADPRSVRSKLQEAVMYGMPLMERVELDTMVTVVDCSVFLNHLGSDEVATAETTPELFYRNEADREADQESLLGFDDDDLPPGLLDALLGGGRATADAVSQLLISQAEVADIVLLNKIDLVEEGSEDIYRIETIVKALNPRGKVVRSTFGRVPLSSILAVAQGKGAAEAGVVDDHKDAVAAALLAHDPNCSDPYCTHESHSHDHSHGGPENCSESHSHDHAHSATSHSHDHSHDETGVDMQTSSHEHSYSHEHDNQEEMTHVGIGSFVYRSRRPFHPARLLAFLRHLAVTKGLPERNESEESLEVTPELEEALKGVFRSKGFVWCADSNDLARYWSHAGISFELATLGKWWATLPRDQWPPDAEQFILSDFDNESHDDAIGDTSSVGDRRQELVFIGQGLADGRVQQEIKMLLNRCILDENELKSYQENKSNQDTLTRLFDNRIMEGIAVF